MNATQTKQTRPKEKKTQAENKQDERNEDSVAKCEE